MLKGKPLRRPVPVVVVAENFAKPAAVEETPSPDIESLTLRGKSVQTLFDEALEIQSRCSDISVADPAKSLTFTPDGKLVYADCQYPMSRYALGQLGTKIGVPAQYIDKCVQRGKGQLAADNVNSWLNDYDRDLFVRLYRNRVRGVLSSRYAVCDAPDVLSVVKDAVDLSEYRVKGSFISEERMHVRLASERMIQIEGDDLYPGLFIDTSDVGRSVVIIRFGIYKQVCTNGLIVSYGGSVLFSQKHVGVTSEEIYGGLAANLKNVPVLIEHAKELVVAAKSKKAWGYNLETSLDEKQTKEFIQRVRNATALTEDAAQSVMTLMREKYGGSMFGLINSITEIAQKYTLERRLELEVAAGRLLAA